MSTRSNIAIELKDGLIRNVYCHNDGYPEHNGVILTTHYNDEDSARNLINLGYLSYVGESLETTIAYHRDRGEDWESNMPQHWGMKREWLRENSEQFNYLYSTTDQKWRCYIESGYEVVIDGLKNETFFTKSLI
jgi:hypothetical protein